MDSLLMASLALLGIGGFVLSTLMHRVSMGAGLLSWCVAVPWLAIYTVVTLWRTDAYSLFQWSGEAQMGPVTLILAVIGLSMFVCGGKSDVRE